MDNVKFRLEAWRRAERRRDRLPPGSAEWQEAEDEVRAAQTAYHAELAQVSARYAGFQSQELDRARYPRLDRGIQRAGE